MMSARTVIIIALSCLGVAAIGFTLVVFGYNAGRVLVFVAVPIGALSGIAGSIAAMTGQLKDDLKK